MATIFIRRRPDSVMEWVSEDVADWLRELKLQKYCKRFQSHLVTGPVILQMDDVLLDDINITLGKERQLLLKESRRLCLQELELVNKAIEIKQKTGDTNSSSSRIPLIKITSHDMEDLKNRENKTLDAQEKFPVDKELTIRSENQISNTSIPEADQSSPDVYKGDPDEVATRATLMVTILSQENSDLRTKLEQCYHNEHQLKDEITNLRAESSEKLQNQQYEVENRQLVTELNELRREYQNLNDSFKQRENDISETLENEIEKLRQDNRLLRDKYQRFKLKAVEREMSRKVSNGKSCNGTNADSQSMSPRESPRQNRENQLQLVEKVYKANKRCAELEDTVRWLYAALRQENSKSENHKKPVTDEDDDQAPSEPEWPSLAGKLPILTTQVNLQDTPVIDADVLYHMVKRGLPTDSDEDIWTRRVTSKTNTSPKLQDVNTQDGLHRWNV